MDITETSSETNPQSGAKPETAAPNLKKLTEDELSALAVQLTDRNYLLSEYFPKTGADPRDIFAKARVYTGVLDELRARDMMQYGVAIESKPGPRVTMEFFGEKRTMRMFASNDYLNLSTDPRVHQAIQTCLKEYGVGAGSSRVGTGYSYVHQKLERKLAESFGKEAAILFPTGFDAIAAPAITFATPNDRVFIDGSSHACILEGAYLSGATVRIFAHNSPDRLEAALKRAQAKLQDGGMMVLIEGAYSMDGDIAKLPEIVEICKRYGARLLVDEAHSIGIHGKQGHGVCEHFELARDVDMIGGTFSKSLGATGGFLAADREVVQFLNYHSRKIVFSAAMPPLLVAGVTAALEIMETDTELRDRLWQNVEYFAKGMKEIGAHVLGHQTGSVPILIANDGIMFRFTQDLIKEGIFTFPAVYPTVPKNCSTFRMAMQAQHSKEDLDHTIEVFDRLLTKYNLRKH